VSAEADVAKRSVGREWIEGVRFIRHDAVVVAVFATGALAWVADGAVTALLVVFVSGVVQGGAEAFGLLMSATRSRRHRRRARRHIRGRNDLADADAGDGHVSGGNSPRDAGDVPTITAAMVLMVLCRCGDSCVARRAANDAPTVSSRRLSRPRVWMVRAVTGAAMLAGMGLASIPRSDTAQARSC